MKNLKQFVIYFVFLIPLSSYTQIEKEYKSLKSQSTSNYYDIVKQVKPILWRNYVNAKSASDKKAAHKALKQFGRWQEHWKDRINIDGSFPNSNLENRVLNLKENMLLSTPKSSGSRFSLEWTQVGPQVNVDPHGYVAYPGMGRVNVVRWLGENTFIAGTPNGGIWKTTDNGHNWEPKTDMLARIGITDILVNPMNPSIMYAVTGDRDGTHAASIGVIKSTDEGETWSTTGLVVSPELEEGTYNSAALGMKPNDPDKLVAIINTSVYYSHDGGDTFEKWGVEASGLNDIMYTDDFILISDINGNIIRSTDDGESFVLIFVGSEEGQPAFVTRFNQEIINDEVYFLAGIEKGAQVFKANTDAILSATFADQMKIELVGNPIDDYNPQGTYNVTIAVNPFNPDKILVCGVDGYFTNDGGETWTKKMDAYTSDTSGETYIHPDHHFSQYLKEDIVLQGHDGGVSLINTNEEPFGHQDLTGNLIIGQIYHAALNPSDDDAQNFLLGLQDNDGFSKSPETKGGNWVAAQAGDGTAAGINQNDPKIRFLGGTNGQLALTLSAFEKGHDDAVPVIGSSENAPFVCEVTIHNEDPLYVFAGHEEMKFSVDGGANFNDAPENMQVGPTEEIEQYGNQVAIVGANGQRIAIFENGVFSEVADIKAPEGVQTNFNSLAISAADGNTLYGTVKGYEDGVKVFVSNDRGLTWSNISFDLPNVITKKVVSKSTNLGEFDEILFLATNIGVYYKLGSDSESWTKLGDNLPYVTVTDLDINYVTDKLYASTFGRGLWEIELSTLISGTDLKNNPLKDISIYPNPVKKGEDINIIFPEGMDQTEYSIYNYIGGRIQQGSLLKHAGNIQTAHLLPGVYLIVFEANGIQFSHKLIIK